MGLSRSEDILEATINGDEYDQPPQSRMEKLLVDLNSIISGGGGGGLTQEEHDALMSIGRYIPNIYDINPTKSIVSGVTASIVAYGANQSAATTGDIPVCGYDKIAMNGRDYNWKYCFRFIDGTYSDIGSLTKNTWTDFISIPENAIAVSAWNTGSYAVLYYSLLTKDSPYNPDNQ